MFHVIGACKGTSLIEQLFSIDFSEVEKLLVWGQMLHFMLPFDCAVKSSFITFLDSF